MDQTITIALISSGATILGFIINHLLERRLRRKDHSDEHIRKLNLVMSSLLDCKRLIERYSSICEMLKIDENELAFPKRMLSQFVLTPGFQKTDCFQELDTAVNNLKEYDPFMYHELEGIGRSNSKFLDDYILPFLRTSDVSRQNLELGPEKGLQDSLEGIQGSLEVVGRRLKLSNRRIQTLCSNSPHKEFEETKEEINQAYFSILKGVLPPELQNYTFKQFDNEIKEGKWVEIKEYINLLLEGNNLEKAIQFEAANKGLNVESLMSLLNNSQSNK